MNRHAERAASRSALEVRAQRERDKQTVLKARDVLRAAIIACGVPASRGVAILAAAESLAKAKMVEALGERVVDPEPVEYSQSGDGA